MVWSCLLPWPAYVAFDSKEHHSFEDVLAVADALMYQKKQQMKKEQNML